MEPGESAQDAAGESRRLVLASASPARLKLLSAAGLRPEVAPSGVNEELEDGATSEKVLVLAERKARAVAPRYPDALVLGCDTLLDLDGRALGKPLTVEGVLDQWAQLAGREASLYTGHFLIETATGRSASGVAETLVRLGTPTREELEAYAATGEPLGLAGACSIDGYGAPFVEGITGDPSNVLGLSLPLLRRLLASLGVAITVLWR